MNAATDRWPRTVVALHWVSASLLIAIFVAGLVMTDLEPTDPLRRNLGRLHTIAANLLALLTLARLFVVRRAPRPAALALSPIHQKGVAVVHALLYVVTLAVIATGLGTGLRTTWHEYLKGDEPRPPSFEGLASREVHEALAMTLVLLVAAHVVGAVAQELKKSGTLRRMLPFLR